VVFTVVLAVATGAVLLGRLPTHADPGTLTQDAAQQRSLPAGGTQPRSAVGQAATAAATPAAPAADTAEATGDDARGGHRGDHRRQAGQQAAAEANPNCTLVVPGDPTSAAGLTTPYQLVATDADQGPCHEANADQAAFVEAAIYDPAAHSVSVYHPLVVDRHDSPAVPPVPVTLPAGAVVGVWFGFNGDTLRLAGPGAGDCVNGLPGSPFGQFAYCNAPALFAAATADSAFQASIPALGTSPRDHLPCPTSRDFSVVDQDQSDNLATVYRVIHGRMAQVTPDTANRGTALTNGSDEGLVAKFIDPALGCRPFSAPDLTDGGTPTPALALNELSAAVRQTAPALVPVSDPMVLVDERTSEAKTNLYRAGVGQPPLPQGQSPREYCAGLVTGGSARLATDAPFLAAAASPDDAQPNLLAFLRDRLQNTLQELKCTGGATARPDQGADAQTSTPAGTGAADQQDAAEPATAAVPTAAAPTTGHSTPGGGAATGTPSPHRSTGSAPSRAHPTRVATPPTQVEPAATPPAATPAAATSPAATPPAGNGN
jgi:hypothetical protein